MGSKEQYEAERRERLKKEVRHEVEREWEKEAPVVMLDCMKRMATALEQIAGSLEVIQTIKARQEDREMEVHSS